MFSIKIPPAVCSQLQKDVEDIINKTGIFARVFSRIKSSYSLNNKLTKKDYKKGEKELQDLFGVRVVLYFKDDISIIRNLITEKYEVKDVSEDLDTIDTFKPKRLNLVCVLPEHILNIINEDVFNFNPIDKTFEIQIRTIFSEGWHEIEHDLRYKRKDEWEKDLVDARILNGIYATLETCDWSILQLFEERAQKKCTDNKIVPLIINKFRLRFENANISEQLETVICMNSDFYSKLCHFNREQLIEDFYYSNLPVTIDNLIYIINHRLADAGIGEINNYTPSIVIKQLECKMLTKEKQHC